MTCSPTRNSSRCYYQDMTPTETSIYRTPISTGSFRSLIRQTKTSVEAVELIPRTIGLTTFSAWIVQADDQTPRTGELGGHSYQDALNRPRNSTAHWRRLTPRGSHGEG